MPLTTDRLQPGALDFHQANMGYSGSATAESIARDFAATRWSEARQIETLLPWPPPFPYMATFVLVHGLATYGVRIGDDGQWQIWKLPGVDQIAAASTAPRPE